KAQLDRQKAETDRWVEVEKNRTEDSLAAFLKEFPDGAMAAKAKKTVEELHNQRAADEEARKAKELQEGIKRQEAGRLKLSIAGRWKLETTAGTVTGGQNHGMVFNPIPGGVICDMQQKGAAVSFKAPYRNLYGGGQCVYKGTYESGSFHAEGKNVIVTGNISEDGRKIVGNWNWGGMSGTAVFTRVDAEAKP
ncbi:MAG: hypothetical protein NT154_12460, partial [Verrucomicrobia bacterium]|nr:hypothetical protein [Verrucomicrobiota bacterium]